MRLASLGAGRVRSPRPLHPNLPNYLHLLPLLENVPVLSVQQRAPLRVADLRPERLHKEQRDNGGRDGEAAGGAEKEVRRVE